MVEIKKVGEKGKQVRGDTRSGLRVGRYKDRIPEILEVAAQLFKEKGFKATSIQDISEKLGLEKGAIYYWIKSKDDILYILIEEEGELFLNMIREIANQKKSPDEKLEELIKNHIKILANNINKAAVFFLELRSLPEKWKKKILRFRDEYESILRNLIEEGQKSGLIRDDIDPKMIGFAILGVINWVYTWYNPKGQKSPDEIADNFAKIILYGVKKQK